MSEEIESKYDEEIRTYTVFFPEHVTFENLSNWKIKFQEKLDTRLRPRSEALLLNSNIHDFESIECLKYLREALTHFANLENGIHKIAFVQPAQYREPEIISKNEAYFVNTEEAKLWLRG